MNPKFNKKSGLYVLFVVLLFLMGFYSYNLEKRVEKYELRIERLEIRNWRLKQKLETSFEKLEKTEELYFKDNAFRISYPVVSKIFSSVFQKSKKYNIDPFIVLALIQVESSFKPNAVSSAGAYGLMQVNYAVWKDELKINFNKIFDIDYNIELGIKIFKHYLKVNNNNLLKAFFMYNNGYKYDNKEYPFKVLASNFFLKVNNS